MTENNEGQGRKKWLIAAAVGLACLVGIGIACNDQDTKTEYYADYVDRWGQPEGVVKLDESQVKKRERHYRFESSNGKLRRVVHANSEGTPIEHSSPEHVDRPAIQELLYTGDRLSAIEMKNAENTTIAAYFLGGEGVTSIDIKQDGAGGAGFALASSFTSKSNLFEAPQDKEANAEVRRFKLTRNEDGHIIRNEFKRYNGSDDVAACDADGVCGFEYDLDSLGRPTEVRYLGYGEGEYPPSPNSLGVMGQTYAYGEHGNLIERSYLGINGNPSPDEDGFATWTTKYDERGNEIEQSYFGVDGNPSLHRDGFAKWTARYDGRGNLVELSYFGIDGQLSLYKDGFARWTARYDERGNLTELSYFGIDGTPSLNKEVGFTKRTRAYDDSSQMLDSKTYGINDELVATSATFLTVLDGGAAHEKGLTSKMILLECSDWVFGGTHLNALKTADANLESGKKLVTLNDAGQIVQHDFGKGPMGIQLTSEEITVDRYHAIEKRYNEWKRGI